MRIKTDDEKFREFAFMRFVKPYRNVLTKQQMRTLKGQALNGDLIGAYKGVETLIKRVRA